MAPRVGGSGRRLLPSSGHHSWPSLSSTLPPPSQHCFPGHSVCPVLGLSLVSPLQHLELLAERWDSAKQGLASRLLPQDFNTCAQLCRLSSRSLGSGPAPTAVSQGLGFRSFLLWSGSPVWVIVASSLMGVEVVETAACLPPEITLLECSLSSSLFGTCCAVFLKLSW